MPDPDSSPPWYDNRSLFSDHYLEERLPLGDTWEEDVSEAWARAREIWEDTGDRLEGLNEAQTEDEFIRPVLESVLGFERTVQTGVRHRERLSRPDYLLFADEEAKRRSEEAEDDAGRYEPAVAVADAKYWGRPLDRHLDDARDELSHANPSFQIVDYLVATGVEWGVLTNGARWRLYFTGARSRIDTFYEADLERILRDGDEDAFRWFQLFFRAAAFVPAPQAERSFLASVHQGSVEYGARLENQLKELIFEDVFLHLARGFLEDWQGNGNGEPDQKQLDEIYQGTLRLLYRLLFLLHAEARGLLPVEQRKGYRGYSLRSVVRDAAEMLDEGATLSAVSTNLWNDLDSLFRIIDRGESDLDVPHYDGGLFRQGHPDNAFLENHAVADRHLVPALDLLAREQERDDRGRKPFVDYKTLNVQQLGSIYEGLLEFRLRRAEEELAVVREDGSEVYEPASEVEEPRQTVAQGELYLMNDKGERKATGSYYTPHYIVEYIVEHTLGPVLEEREERFRELMGRLDEKPGDKILERKAVDALLGIKVCDPAMGSGHFLVHATDWLAEHIIAILNEFPGNPLLRKIEGVREEILGELHDQHVQVDPDRLTDTGLLKRMVMKRCIYGVDLNPMAVELAKLSLWLDSFTLGAPLSFLDHHLKQGNSLIGTTVDEVREALEAEEGQFNLFTGPFTGLLQATEMIREIGEYADVTFDQVEESATLYESFQQKMEPYKRVLDLWVSRHFGNDRAERLLRSHGKTLLDSLRSGGAELPGEQQMTVEDAVLLQQEKSFFHWELEFPEVFIDLTETRWKESPGFDAVITNPPYVSAIELSRTVSEHTKPYWRHYFNAASGAFDLYVIFTEQSTRLLRPNGYAGLITPNKYLSSSYASALRRHLIESTQIARFFDLSRISVFTASVYPIITILKKSPVHATEPVHVDRSSSSGSPDETTLFPRELFLRLPDNIWGFVLHPNGAGILLGILERSDPFLTLDTLSVHAASTAAESEDFTPFIRELEEASAEAFRLVNTGLIDRHASLWGHEQLTHRGDQYQRPTLSVDNNVVPPRRRKQYASHKLICAKVAKRIECVADFDAEYASVNTNFFIPDADGPALGLIAALLNSTLYAWIYRLYFGALAMQGGYLQYQAPQLRLLPFPKETEPDDIPADVCARFDEATEWLAAEGIQAPDKSHSTAAWLDSLAHLWHRLEARKLGQKQQLDFRKFIDTSETLKPLRAVLSEELAKAKVPAKAPDLSSVNHDIDGLRLRQMETGQGWLLEVQLKKRDPTSEWADWIRDDDGRTIAREWVPALWFEMDNAKAWYYHFTLPALAEFANFTSFPSGTTRSTMTKLRLASIPRYQPDTPLSPLVETAHELNDLRRRIRIIDHVIDQLIYNLYDLSDDQIVIIERSSQHMMH